MGCAPNATISCKNNKWEAARDFLRNSKFDSFRGKKTISSTKKKLNFFSLSNFTQRLGASKHEALAASGIQEVEKRTFYFGEVGIFLSKLAFSAVICGI
jgi:hypothetical protein